MRIDKFLKVSRILKRRTLAQESVSSGRIKINGKVVKPAHQVKEGDLVELGFSSGTITIKILMIKETVKKEEAEKTYQVIEG
ncbi:MAG: RNA-binding S4 domain-containing protein [Clostridia bacterium]|nr:RNA-binding S4 domain-containing protein [Clostridia bacterium]